MINTKINHFDTLRLKTKQLAIALWIAALGFGLKEKITMLYVMAALIPIPFWIIDTTYRKYFVGWHMRFFAIGKFIRNGTYEVKGRNTVNLTEFLSSTSENISFPVPDYWGSKTIEKDKHIVETSFYKSFFYHTSVLVYFPMILIALIFTFLTIFGINIV